MNAKITFPELAKLMAKSTSTSQRMCELFLRELFATVSQALINGESVKIKGIGTFKVTSVKSHKHANSADAADDAGQSKLTFTPEKALAEAINQPFAQFESVILADEVTEEKLAEIDKQFTELPDVKEEQAPVQPEPAPESELDQPDMPMAPLPVG